MLRTLARRHPLFAFLAVNLTLGIVVAALAVGGLVALDIHGLRRMILNDQSPLLVLVLLAGGFIVTFGSIVMGSAIMALGAKPGGGGPRRAADSEAAGQMAPLTLAAASRPPSTTGTRLESNARPPHG